MGSSSKKKKEKQKDFQKAKLKVGKAKAKPDNFTDTSFKSKSITLTQQSLTLTAPTTTTQFTHNLSLLSSKSDSQRRDALAHLTTHIVSRPVDTPLPLPVTSLLPTLLPLILDSSTAVRNNLLKFLRALPPSDIPDHVSLLLPYLRAGMTHLAAEIRVSAIEMLAWAVDVAGVEVVSCAGGWIKTLNCFLSVLGWHTPESAKWSGSRASFGKAGKGGAGGVVVKVLGVLSGFLAVGLLPPPPTTTSLPASSVTEESNGAGAGDGEDGENGGGWRYPLSTTEANMVPPAANPYVYLNLFGEPRDEEGEMYETREERFRVFQGRFLTPVLRGLESARHEGGEIGRASAGVRKVVKEAVSLED